MFKKLPISNLSLIILDEQKDCFLRKCAEVELKQRIKNLVWEYQDLLHYDEGITTLRGLDINNYLIGPNPTMQQLMETYFMYRFETWDDGLLFSERHLCNNMNFLSNFFNKICDIEIKNLSYRIENTTINEDKELLTLFKTALEKRKKNIQLDRKQNYQGFGVLEFNDALDSLGREFLLEFGANLSDEEKYRIARSKLLTTIFSMLESMNDGIFDADFFQNAYGLKKVLEDSLKLNHKRALLYHQAKSDFQVDYKSESMRKTYEKVKKYVSSEKSMFW